MQKETKKQDPEIDWIPQIKRNFELKLEHTETPKGVSLTVPDETLTIRQILEKYTRGLDLAAQMAKEPIYDDTDDFDREDLEQITRSDFSERQELLEQLKLDIDIKRKQLADLEQESQPAQDTPHTDTHPQSSLKKEKRTPPPEQVREARQDRPDRSTHERRSEGGRAQRSEVEDD